MQEKPDDAWTLPLCGRHHREQHAEGEMDFWKQVGVRPFEIAAFLWQATGDHERGEQIIRNARER